MNLDVFLLGQGDATFTSILFLFSLKFSRMSS
jgi:hypothetical protein